MTTIGLLMPDPYCATAYAKHGLEIAKRLKADGHTVIILGNQHMNGILEINGFTVTPFIKDPMLEDCIEYWIDKYEIKVVVVLFNFWAVDYLAGVKERKGIKYIIWTPIEGEINIASLKESQHRLLVNADAILGVSQFSTNQLRNAGYDAELALPGVDETYKMLGRNETRKKLGVPEDVFFAGFVGRNYTERKMIPYVLIAFRRLLDKLPEDERKKCTLYLHTERISTSRTYDMSRLIDYYGLREYVQLPSRITAIDPLMEDQMCDVYNLMDVILFPSYGEGLNFPLMEAMRCGVPVIAHDFSGMKELMEGTDAIKIPSLLPYSPQTADLVQTCYLPDLDKMSDALYAAYRDYKDKDAPKEWPWISTSEMEKAKVWTWDSTYRQFKAVLDKVMAK